jgi:hypothetical protein
MLVLKIYLVRRQFTVAQFTAVTIHHRHNSPRHKIIAAQFIAGTIHGAQFTAHNSPHTIHRVTIHRAQFTAKKNPLDEFLILLDDC